MTLRASRPVPATRSRVLPAKIVCAAMCCRPDRACGSNFCLKRLGEMLGAVGAVGAHPEATRLAATLQPKNLAGVAKGLTRTADSLAFNEEEESGRKSGCGGGAGRDAGWSCVASHLSGALSAHDVR
ncbi:hypothetical protein B0H19DRAFT_1068329 [Mycena capillaripes]|nr:hypothetical protein B0H19DRAFT_1068329 [Mycena capillaripes]